MYQNYNGKDKNSSNRSNIRINILALFVFLFSLAIILKLGKLQIVNFGFYNALASDQHQIFTSLFPRRGEIFVHNDILANTSKDSMREGKIYDKLYPIAANKKYEFVFAEPKNVEDPERAAEILSQALELDKEELKNKLSQKDDPYEPLMHRVDEKIVNQINLAKLTGISSVSEYYRYYPDDMIGGHLLGYIGYVDDKKKGQYGIEGYFDELLTGKPGFIKTEKDVGGKAIKIWDSAVSECEDGADIILTIDYNIQHEICKELKKGIEDSQAAGGTVIVMDPFTGSIKGMCSAPDFNPDKYSEVSDISVFNNPAIFDQYEPGSTFKSITAAIALDLDKIKPETTYDDDGEVKIGQYTIRNSDLKAHGKTTMTQVLEGSYNTGAIFMSKLAGKENFQTYVKNFGFGELTGVELNTEVKGDISSLEKKGEIYTATASFGQGIAVTPIQMITAYAALANGGKLPKPYIVDKIIKNKKEVIKTQPQIVRQVISERASALISAMLVSVVEKSYAKKIDVKGYYIAGKTGTAQVSENGVYGNKTIHSFISFAPIENPQFVVLVKIDYPQKGRFAESTAVPVSGKILEFLINYYGIKPNR